MTFIRPITRNIGFFYAFQPKIPVLGQIFQFLQKVIFADLTFIRPITPKFRGGNDFYKTNHSKIHEIRPITPKVVLIVIHIKGQLSMHYNEWRSKSKAARGSSALLPIWKDSSNGCNRCCRTRTRYQGTYQSQICLIPCFPFSEIHSLNFLSSYFLKKNFGQKRCKRKIALERQSGFKILSFSNWFCVNLTIDLYVNLALLSAEPITVKYYHDFSSLVGCQRM